MTCKDIMTPSPSCCLPSDSVAIAAQIMRRNDVGAVLVVSDHHENRLVGIVTDRDLAIKVIADGRDPHTTRVDEVMTLNPISCHENDGTEKALRLMAEHQVRRIPIVDANDRLSGIVAQADIARNEDEEDVGRLVGQISEPYGSSSWTEVRPLASWPKGGSLALGSLCMGIGAGLMYVLDTSRGNTERGRDAANPSDSKLRSSVRSEIARCASYPNAIHVQVVNGNVTLSGPVLATEVRNVIDSVTEMEGVRSLESRLEVHDYEGSHPDLQGGGGLGAGTLPLSLLAGAAAGALLIYQGRFRRQTVQYRRGETPGY